MADDMSSVLWRWLHRRELLQTLWILSTAKRLINFANARCRWQRWRHKSRSGRTNCPQSAQQCRLWLIHRERERERAACANIFIYSLLRRINRIRKAPIFYCRQSSRLALARRRNSLAKAPLVALLSPPNRR